LLSVILANCAYSQLVIDAGSDTTICSILDTITLGGNPTAYGGTLPHTYEWTVYSGLSGNNYPANLFLSDSTDANPAITNMDPFLNDILIVRLLVMDSIGNTGIDSIQVGISSIGTQTLMDCGVYGIISGDSVMVHVCNHFMGMQPYTYHWTPEEIFSDPYIENPWAKPDTSITISVELTDVIGCSNSEQYGIVVIPLGIDPISNKDMNSSIFPNPIDELSKIVIKGNYLLLSIRIYDLQARLVVDDYVYNNSFEVGRVIKEQGVYYYIVSEESKIISIGKFIKD